MDGTALKLASRKRVRHARLAVWAVAVALSVGVVALVTLLQLDGYRSMLGNARRQLSGSASGTVRMIDQDIDASLGPLLALRNAVDGPEPGALHARLAEVQARHPELPAFVALDADGRLIASTSVPLLDWRGSLAAPRRMALGASVRVRIADRQGAEPPAIRVLVDARVPQPAAFGTLIDAARVRDGMRHSLLGLNASMTVFSLDGRPFATNRDDIDARWTRPLPASGQVGHYDDDDRLYAWQASARYPFVALVSLDRNGIVADWMRQARPSMLATLALVLLLNGFAALFDRAYRRQTRLVDALSRSARHLGDVQRTGHIGLWEADLVNQTIAWSGLVHEITGLPPERVGGRIGTYYKLVHPADQSDIVEWLRLFSHGDGPYECEHRLCRPDGREVRVNLRAARITNEEGHSILSGTISEITVLHETRQRLENIDRDLAASEAAYRQLLARMPLPLLIVREGCIEYANHLAEERLGSMAAPLVGRRAANFLDAEALEAIDRGAPEGTNATAWIEPEYGMPFEAELALSDYRDPRGRGTLAIIRDVTEQRRYEDRLNHQATHDELTGLPNRRALRERLDALLVESVAAGTGLMVMFIDLDHFKVINDALGHVLGDQVLRDISLRLGDVLGAQGHVGRFGGDEFVAMVPFDESPVKAVEILPRLQRAIEEPLAVDGTLQRLKCSIGVAFATRDGADADTLIRNADTAMYDAKRSGRHAWRCYSAEMHATAMARLNVLTRLSEANLDNELALAWQTQHDGADGTVTGVEVLLRWPSAPGDLLGNERLVPLLEETGAIVPIGQWVLREACRQQRLVLETLGQHCRIAVNVSAQQLVHTDLAAEVRRILDETGARASALELELTESAFMHEPERAIRTLHELRAMGVTIALDDFGTGYSNLTYLSRLPLDKIKIDRHFTARIEEDHFDTAICRSIVFLARNLDLHVVAEGVETERQRRWLLDEACVAMQGYFFSRPVPVEQLGRDRQVDRVT
ncbi:PAS domain S-box-containing protein/diguanylate cyclase (GGDEF) domain-containing protein [Luteibacter sp. UNC138MFCol5.1]|uniref:bifunctional diguanylate cyclase/phosphodiesterase n=1 Tax=Luteibacter sp. UNC138MFCol5.1 TaxID=1502774 RepID=UPI0008BB2DC7|nr:EAL domain-containing protein [Luteibacter sp. UNC138MFCol5.1]SEO36861.1 PAS domain S-box-containing protein/diguanylate cyclase (GGDEF) domain-containing protein [Luteibacter sp. UNC138MFCol5.1]